MIFGFDEAGRLTPFNEKKTKSTKINRFEAGSSFTAHPRGKYATEKNYQIEYYPAMWSQYGKSAGPMRNEKMAQICDFVICFWDGKSKGTKSMIEFAKKYDKPIRIKMI